MTTLLIDKTQGRKKCYVRHFLFHDNTERIFHTECGPLPMPIKQMTDAWGNTLNPQAKLKAVRDEVHFV